MGTYASPTNEHWYVAARSGRDTALVLGPYDDHATAARHIEQARLYVLHQRTDMATTFAEWGVLRIVTDTPEPGKLNDVLGHLEPAVAP